MAKRKIDATRNDEAWGYRSPWYRFMNLFQKRVGKGVDLRAKILEKQQNGLAGMNQKAKETGKL